MTKLFVLLLLFNILSCEKEKAEKEVISSLPDSILVIRPEGKIVAIDSVLLNSPDNIEVKDFYKLTDYKTVWQFKENRKIILEQLYNSEDEGLNPEDYNVGKLRKHEKKFAVLDEQDIAKYDVLLTLNLQKYISHLTNGTLNPRKLYPDWDLKENKIDLNETLAKLVIGDSLAEKLELLKPQHQVYKKLKKALKIINTFPNENFSKIEITNKIVQNDTNESIINIKKRLIYWRDLKPKDSLSPIYDEETVDAVKNFQIRHGLSADGVIGKGTVESLNFSKNQRKHQIIANLERWKWFPKDLKSEYIIINIPDYKLILVNNKDTLRVHKVIVGRPKRKTPVLSSIVTQAVFNPTWTVPPTILREDVIPAVLKNRNYLAQTNIKLYDSNGNEVPASNWSLSKAKSYRYVQSPGTFNSLGMVKLIFPNRFSVYLHDTNHRDFFEKSVRSLSSGCVRVNNPLELTEYLMDDETNWNIEKITQTLQSAKTIQIKINKEVFIHILYWTAWSEKNILIFRDDIYSLDADLYDKLRR